MSCYACWLRHVISGILAGGIPGFRMVLLLLRSPPGMALCFCCSSLLFLLPYLVKMIQCYHSCINSTMNWYLSHLCLAVLFWVGALLCGFFVWFVFGFWFFVDVVTDWTMYRSFTRSLLKPLNLQAAMYALISQLTLVCNMQLNVLDDLAEAMKALDGKKGMAFSNRMRSTEMFSKYAWSLCI